MVTMPKKPRLESEIVAQVLLACNRIPGVHLRRLNSRVIRMPGKGGRDRLVRFGWLGAPDIIGFKAEERPAVALARFIALEVKTPARRGNATTEQRAFLDLVTRSGGIAAVVTSVEEAFKALGAA